MEYTHAIKRNSWHVLIDVNRHEIIAEIKYFCIVTFADEQYFLVATRTYTTIGTLKSTGSRLVQSKPSKEWRYYKVSSIAGKIGLYRVRQDEKPYKLKNGKKLSQDAYHVVEFF